MTGASCFLGDNFLRQQERRNFLTSLPREFFLFEVFALGIFGAGGVSRYAATPLIVALSPGHSDITSFRPWSPIATGNHLDRVEKVTKVAQTTDTVEVFDPRSGISGLTSRRASACQNLHE